MSVPGRFLYLYLQKLCARHHENDLLSFSSLFQTYLSSSSLLPSHEFKRYLQAILPLVSSDPILLSSILTVCRKSLHHLDIPRRLLAIDILVELFFTVSGSQDQQTILDLLLLILSYPLKYKQLFYSKFLNLFLKSCSRLVTKVMPLRALYRALCQQCDTLFRSNSLPSRRGGGRVRSRGGRSSQPSEDIREWSTQPLEVFSRWGSEKTEFHPSNCCIVTNPLPSPPPVTAPAVNEEPSSRSIEGGSEEEIFLQEDVYQLLVLVSSLETFLLLSSSSQSAEIGEAVPSILLAWSERNETEVEEKLFHFTETISIGSIPPPFPRLIVLTGDEQKVMFPAYCLSILSSALAGFPSSHPESGNDLCERYSLETSESAKRSLRSHILLHHSVYFHALMSIRTSLRISCSMTRSFRETTLSIDLNKIREEEKEGVTVRTFLLLDSVIETLTRLSSPFLEEKYLTKIIERYQEVYVERAQSASPSPLLEQSLASSISTPSSSTDLTLVFRDIFALIHTSLVPQTAPTQKSFLPLSHLVGLLSLSSSRLSAQLCLPNPVPDTSSFTENDKDEDPSRIIPHSTLSELLSMHLLFYDRVGRIEKESELLETLIVTHMSVSGADLQPSHTRRERGQKKRKSRTILQEKDISEGLSQRGDVETTTDQEASSSSITETDSRSRSLRSFEYLVPIYQTFTTAFSQSQSLDCLVWSGALDKSAGLASEQGSKKKLKADLFDHFRQQLFTLRYELLQGISSLLIALAQTPPEESLSENSLCSLDHDNQLPRPVDFKWRLLSSFISQFYLAVKDGLTVRNFNVCLLTLSLYPWLS
jgi:hypothetical protein